MGTCRFENIPQCAEIRVEAAADVLNIEHERVQAGKLFGGWLSSGPEERIDHEFCLCIHTICDVFVMVAAYSMLRSEKSFQRDPRRLMQHINCRQALACQPGVVCDEADAAALEPREIFSPKNVDSRRYFCHPCVFDHASL